MTDLQQSKKIQSCDYIERIQSLKKSDLSFNNRKYARIFVKIRRCVRPIPLPLRRCD
jgi:hypothetical protein